MKGKKGTVIILLVLSAVILFAGCARQEPSVPDGQKANARVVVKEAAVMDGRGNTVGTAYPGFALMLEDGKEGEKARFIVTEMADDGQDVKAEKEFFIDVSYMQEGYIEPQAVVMMISGDMIQLAPGGSLYDQAGEKLITFTDGLGPMYYIQSADLGYMFTLDMNIVYAKEDDVTVIQPILPS